MESRQSVRRDKDEFEFEGYVESINAKGAGPNSFQFLFSLVNESGEHNSYLLDPREPLRLTAMASLLTGAFSGDKKVKIRTAPNIGGQPFAGELEVVRV